MPKGKGLPKKYAKMGFAKGWKAYKAQQRKTASKRRSSTRKGQVRKTARRAFMPKNKNNRGRRMARKTMPHPSLTGLASGAMVLSWLNSKSGWTGRTEGKESVSSWLMKGNIDKAFNRLLENTKTLFKPGHGLPVATGAVALAVAGSIARKHIPNVKIGSSKVYARL